MSDKQLDADEIAEQVHGLEQRTRDAVVADILTDLEQAFKEGPLASEGEVDTWASGFAAAVATIRENYS